MLPTAVPLISSSAKEAKSSGEVSRHVRTEEREPSPVLLWCNDHGFGLSDFRLALSTTLWFRDSDVQFFPHWFTRMMDGSKSWTGSHLMNLWGYTWGCDTKTNRGTCTVSHRVRIWGWWNISFEASEARINQSTTKAAQKLTFPLPALTRKKQKSCFYVKNIEQSF